MIATSRPRPITVLLLILIIGFFGYMITGSIRYQAAGKSFFAEGRREYNAYDVFFTIFLLALVVYLIWYFLWRWTVVSIDSSKQQLKVFHPFQLYKQVYHCSDIHGFYLTSRYSKWCEIKVMVFLYSTDKKIKISDFETGNFRTIEAAAWKELPLVDEKTNAPLTTVQKETYRIDTNKNFDIKQAKSIRFSLIAALIGLLVVFVLEYGFLFGTVSRRLPVVVQVLLLMVILFLLYELLRIKRILRELKEQ